MCRCVGRNGVIPALTVALKMTCVCVALFRPTASKLDHSLWTMTETGPHFNPHFTSPFTAAYTERGSLSALLAESRACIHSWSTRGRRSGDGHVIVM